MRLRPSPITSLTPSAQPARTLWTSAAWKSVAASISTTAAPRFAQLCSTPSRLS